MNLFLIVAGFAGAALVAYTMRGGIGLTPDSVDYVQVAENISAGNGARFNGGNPLTNQPPLYPLVLSSFQAFGISPLLAMRLLHALMFGMIIFLSGRLLFQHTSVFLTAIGTLLIILLIPVFVVSTAAWSESLFILLVTGTLLLAEQYRQKPSLETLIILAGVVALACLTRYIGIVLLVTIAVAVSMSPGGYRHAFAFTLAAGLPVGVWLARNYIVSGYAMGQKSPSTFTLLQNIQFSADTIRSWVIPGNQQIVSLGVLLLVLVVLVACWRNVEPAQTFIVFIVLYLAFLIVSSSMVAYDQIGNRLLAPIAIPLLVVVLYSLEVVWKYDPAKFAVALAALVIWSAYSAGEINSMVRDPFLGFNSPVWRESAAVEFVKENRQLCPMVYSNQVTPILLFADNNASGSPAKIDDRAWPHGEACLVWFDNVDRWDIKTVDELNTLAEITSIAKLSDSTIYRVSPKTNSE